MKLDVEVMQADDAFFAQSGIMDFKTLKMTQPLVFIPDGNGNARVVVETKPAALLVFPDEARVFMAWQGEWRSDIFTFTIAEFRAQVVAHPPRWKR